MFCTPASHPGLVLLRSNLGEGAVMAKDWRCRIGSHDWREVEMPDRDKCA